MAASKSACAEGVKGLHPQRPIGECLGHWREPGTKCVFMELLIKTKPLPVHLDGRVGWKTGRGIRKSAFCSSFCCRLTPLQVIPSSILSFSICKIRQGWTFFIRNVRENFLIIFIKTMANEYFHGGSALIQSLIYSC